MDDARTAIVLDGSGGGDAQLEHLQHLVRLVTGDAHSHFVRRLSGRERQRARFRLIVERRRGGAVLRRVRVPAYLDRLTPMMRW